MLKTNIYGLTGMSHLFKRKLQMFVLKKSIWVTGDFIAHNVSSLLTTFLLESVNDSLLKYFLCIKNRDLRQATMT